MLQPLGVFAIRDSICRPMLYCLSQGASKERQGKIALELKRLDKLAQNGRLKKRPCVPLLVGVRATNITGPDIPICLMATFRGSLLKNLPELVQHFAIPVETGSRDWDIRTFGRGQILTTTPQWKPSQKNRTGSHRMICFKFPSNERALIGRCRVPSIMMEQYYHLCSEQVEHLVDLCKEKEEFYNDKARCPEFRDRMWDSTMAYIEHLKRKAGSPPTSDDDCENQ
ncbi:hypothetical protein GYMLUDRAFT_256339 [Collybiopsis luxurians FD-317 M1]|nr:hypothetical protein GYMLUDRAFT_256339 [Collybiopsis luxurians FD-317 M1]